MPTIRRAAVSSVRPPAEGRAALRRRRRHRRMGERSTVRFSTRARAVTESWPHTEGLSGYRSRRRFGYRSGVYFNGSPGSPYRHVRRRGADGDGARPSNQTACLRGSTVVPRGRSTVIGWIAGTRGAAVADARAPTAGFAAPQPGGRAGRHPRRHGATPVLLHDDEDRVHQQGVGEGHHAAGKHTRAGGGSWPCGRRQGVGDPDRLRRPRRGPARQGSWTGSARRTRRSCCPANIGRVRDRLAARRSRWTLGVGTSV